MNDLDRRLLETLGGTILARSEGSAMLDARICAALRHLPNAADVLSRNYIYPLIYNWTHDGRVIVFAKAPTDVTAEHGEELHINRDTHQGAMVVCHRIGPAVTSSIDKALDLLEFVVPGFRASLHIRGAMLADRHAWGTSIDLPAQGSTPAISRSAMTAPLAICAAAVAAYALTDINLDP